ncbi:MAG: type IV pilus secretin PilQ [Deltaproteobacteria bacterium]|nr:type IV pilus secretin PilQ [Deltaproteobacteria bacterium]
MTPGVMKRLYRNLSVTLILASLLSCSSHMVAKKETIKTPSNRIRAITTDEDKEFVYVTVKGDRALTFTSVKQPFPLAVILYFPETLIDTPRTSIEPDVEAIRKIRLSRLTAKVPAAKMEISLKRDVPYEVSRQGGELRISFRKVPEMAQAGVPLEEEKLKRTAAGTDSLPAASVFRSITTESFENGMKIWVKANGAIKDYHSFTIKNPARIVFDFFNVKSPQREERKLAVNTQWVKRIRSYSYPDRVRMVVDTAAQYLSSYSAKPVKDGLLIQVGPVAGIPSEVSRPVDVSKKERIPPPSPPSEATKIPAQKEKKPKLKPQPQAPAWVNRIDFLSQPEGKSTIVIGTSRPVKYELQKIGEKRLQLKLINTRFPDYRQRPLITTRFASAVDRIMPFHSAALKDTALISIELREAVPYIIEQQDALLRIGFEASSIPPRSFEEAKLPAWKEALVKAAAEKPKPEKRVEKLAVRPTRETSKKKYTGEKIALDFYETDIKNVFRILREVSGKNFAIDKDVSGKVTLSLDKPVPWDQVLDLVLKMNQLGTVVEGDIIRIATQETLKREQEIKRAKAAAELESKQQEKALEPLVTEFISVNYANAEQDVKPHIVLTPERGSITVDKRNNQIIITDTAEMVKRAKETVRKIDRVTPQVIIEARVVEASSSFSRELGTQLSIQAGPIFTSEVGDGVIPEGSLNYDMSATNPPSQTLGQIGINFSKLMGSPFTLDARLAASESEGKVKIISSPRVMTLDNKTARIRQGTQVPIPRLDDSGNTVIDYKDVDLELEVTPHVTPDKRISLTIKVTNNEIGQIINNQQSFTTKEANTELLVDNGQTIVIGGIRKTRKDTGESGVPGFREIPIFGWLFKKETRSEDLQELLIFITPHIVQLEQRG